MGQFTDPSTHAEAFFAGPEESTRRRSPGGLLRALQADPQRVQDLPGFYRQRLPPDVLALLQDALRQFAPTDDQLGRRHGQTTTAYGAEYNRAPMATLTGSLAFQGLDQPSQGQVLETVRPVLDPAPRLSQALGQPPAPPTAPVAAPPPESAFEPPPAPEPAPLGPALPPYDPYQDPDNPLFWLFWFPEARAEGGEAPDVGGDPGGGGDGAGEAGAGYL